MTRQVNNAIHCKYCGGVGICQDCKKTIMNGSQFSDWFRLLDGELTSKNFDLNDLDFIWLHYRAGWLITIESKSFGAMPPKAQLDTQNIVRQLLLLSSGKSVSTWRGVRSIEYRGHYIIVFDGAGPLDSKEIKIYSMIDSSKGNLITVDENGLKKFLSIGKFQD